MTDHPTLEPTAFVHTVTVHVSAEEPSGGGATTAAFADLVCADQELLRAEFDAIITANFPDAAEGAQRLAPPGTIPTGTHGTRWVAPRCGPALPSHDPEWRPLAGAQRPRARQRGPPQSNRK